MVFDREADHAKAEKIARECAVLLTNDGILPLDTAKKIVYIGEYAEKPRYQGGGSSHINSSKVVSALETAKAKGRNVEYVKGFPFDKDEEDEALFAEAVEAAKNADAAVIFAGLPDVMESEGYDRPHMKMPVCQDRLIEAVAAVNKNTVVVLHNGSPVEMPWADKAAAILEMYLGGQGVGAATDALLYGEANPSGHLAESFPFRVQDNPSYLNFNTDPETCNYAEGVYVGYRYYDSKEMPVRFAFGHGLSYTTFRIDNIRLSAASMDDDGTIDVSVDVTNTGDRAGKEVVQLYISDKNKTPDRPVKELKGFAKVALEPGETKTVTLTIDARSLSYYNEALKDWYAPNGTYGILVGDASDKIAVSADISFTTRKIPPMRLDPSITIGELLANPATAPIVGQMIAQAKGNSPIEMPDNDPMSEAMMKFMPLKSMISFGVMDKEKMLGLLQLIKNTLGK